MSNIHEVRLDAQLQRTISFLKRLEAMATPEKKSC